MSKTVKKVGRQLFAFLSSLQLAVVLLFSLAAILAVGTFYESAYDADTAKHYVYGTWWFAAYLGLLGTNVLFAALSRWPWKRRHTGFLIVHLGILTILAGSFITLFLAYEGQIIIAEGETQSRLFLKDPSLYFYEASQGRLEEIPAKFRFSPPRPDSPFGAKVLDKVLVKVDEYLPHAVGETHVEEGSGEENPALLVQLSGSNAQVEEWIFSREYDKQRLNLGPASVTFLELPDQLSLNKILEQKELRGPVLLAGSTLLPLKGNLGRAIAIGKKVLFIENFLPHAAVTRGILVNRSPKPENPVAKLTLKDEKGREQRHTVFAKFPKLPTLHGEENAPLLPLKLFWIPESLGEQKNELALAQTPTGKLYYALRQGGIWQNPNILPREGEVSTGWMDFKFSIKKITQHAEIKRKYKKINVPKGKQGPPPAIHLALAGEGQMTDLWIGRGESREVRLGPKTFKVAYALKSEPLGFELKLRDFIMGTYEGTQDPASYESEVTLLDPANRVQEDHLIAMNQPLDYKKFKIFQASYQINPDGPDWSVFSVSYDPGVPVKYLGSLVLVLGIIIIFFFRPFFLRKKRVETRDIASEEKDSQLGTPKLKNFMPKAFSIILFFSLVLLSGPLKAQTPTPTPKPGMDLRPLQEVVILEGGRQKPFDTYARETVRFITGRETFAGFDPNELILSWLTQTPLWEKIPLIKVAYRPLIQYLQLPTVDGKIAPAQLRSNSEFILFLQTVKTRQDEGIKLNEMEREGGVLSERLNRFYQIAEGTSLFIFPQKSGGWESLAQLSKRFPNFSLKNTPPSSDAQVAAGFQGLLTAYHQNDPALFSEIGLIFKNILEQHGNTIGNYPSQKALMREIHFNRLKPFQWAWAAYAMAAFILLLSYGTKGPWVYRLGVLVFLAGFGLHSYGFILRIMISGRPPVTNMYETVIWIPYGAAFFGLILEAIYRSRIYLLAASVMATLGLILAQSAPSILDPSIDPLVPVLRNNFWLTVHVLTITLSYGAFTLALGVGNINLGFYLLRPRSTERIQKLNFFIYRAIQIGVVLLAAGTLLGGVWANQSWGRFWGWDPKEVWALIALLGYLVVLHGRYAGWVKGFGLTVGSVLAYMLVLMAWYGVNFILGVGLHSYGFSSGGAKFVSFFVGFEILWIILALLRYKFSTPVGKNKISPSPGV